MGNHFKSQDSLGKKTEVCSEHFQSEFTVGVMYFLPVP